MSVAHRTHPSVVQEGPPHSCRASEDIDITAKGFAEARYLVARIRIGPNHVTILKREGAWANRGFLNLLTLRIPSPWLPISILTSCLGTAMSETTGKRGYHDSAGIHGQVSPSTITWLRLPRRGSAGTGPVHVLSNLTSYRVSMLMGKRGPRTKN